MLKTYGFAPPFGDSPYRLELLLKFVIQSHNTTSQFLCQEKFLKELGSVANRKAIWHCLSGEVLASTPDPLIKWFGGLEK